MAKIPSVIPLDKHDDLGPPTPPSSGGWALWPGRPRQPLAQRNESRVKSRLTYLVGDCSSKIDRGHCNACFLKIFMSLWFSDLISMNQNQLWPQSYQSRPSLPSASPVVACEANGPECQTDRPWNYEILLRWFWTNGCIAWISTSFNIFQTMGTQP